MASAFETLMVYPRAVDFADSVTAATVHFPRCFRFLARITALAVLFVLDAAAYHCWVTDPKVVQHPVLVGK